MTPPRCAALGTAVVVITLLGVRIAPAGPYVAPTEAPLGGQTQKA